MQFPTGNGSWREVSVWEDIHTYPVQTTGNAKHTNWVPFVGWGSEGTLKDEESLCLDATFYDIPQHRELPMQTTGNAKHTDWATRCMFGLGRYT